MTSKSGFATDADKTFKLKAWTYLNGNLLSGTRCVKSNVFEAKFVHNSSTGKPKNLHF
jgi:hypothetical protein